MEVLFDETNFPGFVVLSYIRKVVIAVDVDEIKKEVLSRIGLFSKPLIENQIVLFQIASQFPPDNQCAFAIGRSSSHSAKPETGFSFQ